MKTEQLMSTGYYPCPWDDFINKNGKVIVSVYTLDNAKKDNFLGLNKKGIFIIKKRKFGTLLLMFQG